MIRGSPIRDDTLARQAGRVGLAEEIVDGQVLDVGEVRRPRNLIALLTAFWLTARAFMRQHWDRVDTPAACALRGW